MFHPTIIASGISFKGTMTCQGDCIIYGHVEGDIFSEETVLIEENGFFKGHIHAPSIVVKGVCEGEIYGDIVKILPHGHIKGNIESTMFMMYPKALFEGIKRTVEKKCNDTPHQKRVTEFDTENILL